MVMGTLRQEAEVAIIGGGPGGYVAAIRAASLGKEVLLVDERKRRGGTCLIEGCIPSKTLISAVELIGSAREAERYGIRFGEVSVDREALYRHAGSVVDTLSRGIDFLLERRGVEVLTGRAVFDGLRSLRVEQGKGKVVGVDFRHAIIAPGSRATPFRAAEGLPVWGSAQALTLPSIPEHLLVIGGGYIGLELGLVYAGLGSAVTVVELTPRLLAAADEDLVDVVAGVCAKRFREILTETRVVGMESSEGGVAVRVETNGVERTIEADQVLAAVGRTPNSDRVGLEALELKPDVAGRILVDERCRTAHPHIYAIGDVAPGPMLAHKASREAKVAAEVIAGHKSAFDARAIPAVVFTDPEIAWAGLSEQDANALGVPYRVGRFPLRALGRARTLGREKGLVKVLADPDSGRVLGVGMVGPQASELIAEAALALEMGATVEDLAATIHPHPTLSEGLMEAAEVCIGMPVHVPSAKGGA